MGFPRRGQRKREPNKFRKWEPSCFQKQPETQKDVPSPSRGSLYFARVVVVGYVRVLGLQRRTWHRLMAPEQSCNNRGCCRHCGCIIKASSNVSTTLASPPCLATPMIVATVSAPPLALALQPACWLVVVGAVAKVAESPIQAQTPSRRQRPRSARSTASAAQHPMLLLLLLLLVQALRSTPSN